MVLSETQRDTRDLVSARSTAAERSYTSPPSARDVATSARHSRPTARCACQVTTVTTEGTSAGRRIDKPSNVLLLISFVSRLIAYATTWVRLDRYGSK